MNTLNDFQIFENTVLNSVEVCQFVVNLHFQNLDINTAPWIMVQSNFDSRIGDERVLGDVNSPKSSSGLLRMIGAKVIKLAFDEQTSELQLFFDNDGSILLLKDPFLPESYTLHTTLGILAI